MVIISILHTSGIGSIGHLAANGAVFDDHAVSGFQAQPLGCQQVDTGVRLLDGHVITRQEQIEGLQYVVRIWSWCDQDVVSYGRMYQYLRSTIRLDFILQSRTG